MKAENIDEGSGTPFSAHNSRPPPPHYREAHNDRAYIPPLDIPSNDNLHSPHVQFTVRSPSIIPSPVYDADHSVISSPSPKSVQPLQHVQPPSPADRHDPGTDMFDRPLPTPSAPPQEKTLAEEYGPRFADQEEIGHADSQGEGRDHSRGQGLNLLTLTERSMDTVRPNRFVRLDIAENQSSPVDEEFRAESAPNRAPSIADRQPPPPYQAAGPLTVLLRPIGRPYFTWISAVVMMAVLIFELVQNSRKTGSMIANQPLNPMIGPRSTVLVNMGVKYTPCIRPLPTVSTSRPMKYCYQNSEDTCTLEMLCGFGGFHGALPDQSFRFILPMFMHAGIIHFAVNMVAHLRLGSKLECAVGPIRFIVMYFVAGFSGFLFSAVLAEVWTTSMGCSGAIFGLIGYMFIDIMVHWRAIPRPVVELLKLLVFTIVLLVIGLLPGIDNFVHLGGFIAGLFMGVIAIPMRPKPSKRTICLTWTARLLVVFFLLLLFIAFIMAFYTVPNLASVSLDGCL
ncbi:hypothetical protein DFQ28_007361 [Apophysomyces sp. BC1034]|nr:hypothetical protein DFQ30_004174 [Apophysomyces sp. BC1015]KAG0176323.1 hypothetical protein DFQ29_006288 [Apophysomyces sp. BC1021]KAG0186757.1 hypothetical protein DFQ28_007361 [Apophysomyces sp. BC1034]